MSKLPIRVQIHILQSLAGFATPSTVVRSVKETFGLEVSPQQVEAYNPERAAGAKLRPMLRRLFNDTRAAVLADIAGIGVAHRSFRLHKLQELYEAAKLRGNTVAAAGLLKQAAQEMGDAFTNRRDAVAIKRAR